MVNHNNFNLLKREHKRLLLRSLTLFFYNNQYRFDTFPAMDSEMVPDEEGFPTHMYLGEHCYKLDDGVVEF